MTRPVPFLAATSNNRHNEENPIRFLAVLENIISVFSVRYNGTQSNFSPDPWSQEIPIPGELVKAAFH